MIASSKLRLKNSPTMIRSISLIGSALRKYSTECSSRWKLHGSLVESHWSQEKPGGALVDLKTGAVTLPASVFAKLLDHQTIPAAAILGLEHSLLFLLMPQAIFPKKLLNWNHSFLKLINRASILCTTSWKLYFSTDAKAIFDDVFLQGLAIRQGSGYLNVGYAITKTYRVICLLLLTHTHASLHTLHD